MKLSKATKTLLLRVAIALPLSLIAYFGGFGLWAMLFLLILSDVKVTLR